MDPDVERYGQDAEKGKGTPREVALEWIQPDGPDLPDLLYWANRVRERHKGNRVHFCSILSAKQGRCPEDCRFCAQSARHGTSAETFPLREVDRMLAAVRECDAHHCDSFGLVTSGLGPKQGPEWEQLLGTIRQMASEGRLLACASFGQLTPLAARQLREAGLRRYNHNLETSPRYFPSVCTTHTFEDRMRTILHAKAAGLQVCSGGIFGMGENATDRVELAAALRKLDVASIPINFLNPVPGTPFENVPPLAALECLRILAVYRLFFPTKEIKVAGGRETCLRDLQSWIFLAGANGAILGNYLTTSGRNAEDDLRMIRDLGMEPVPGKEAVNP